MVRHDGVGGDDWYWYALQWRSYRDNRTFICRFSPAQKRCNAPVRKWQVGLAIA